MKEAAEVIFLLLTQVLMLYKVNNIQYQLERVQLAVNELQASIFQPQNADEDELREKRSCFEYYNRCVFSSIE